MSDLLNEYDLRLIYILNDLAADGAGESYLKKGIIDGVFSTVDFGPTKKAREYFELQQNYSKGGKIIFFSKNEN